MLSKLQAALEHLLAPRESLLAGVSGGADSVALLDGLVRLGWRPHVCHLNHRLRGPDSEADAEFVRRRAERYGLPVTVECREVAAYAADQKLSLEDAARRVRHEFFAAVAARTGITTLALAHTADDQVETVLLRLVRGAGVTGLGGIRPERRLGALRVIRPLLEVRRAEIVEYLNAAGLDWREDATNRDPLFLRNRVRHELLPLLERDYNPAIRAVLERTAAVLRDEDAYLERHAVEICSKAIGADGALDVKALAAQPVAVQRRLLQWWLGGEDESVARLGFEQLEAVRQLARADSAGGQLSLSDDRVVYREYDRLRLARPAEVVAVTGRWPLEAGVPLTIAELGVRFEAEGVAGGAVGRLARTKGERDGGADGAAPSGSGGSESRRRATLRRRLEEKTTVGDTGADRVIASGRATVSRVAAATWPHAGTRPTRGEAAPAGVWTEVFDADTLGAQPFVRTWQAGDRFQPLGMADTKKLQDFFVDEKVPKRRRNRVPLLCATDGRIAWVVGWRMAEPFKLTARTRRAVRVRAEEYL